MSTRNTRSLSFSKNSANLDLQLLISALDASVSGVTITDNRQEDNPIIYCNEAFMKMTGYAEHEIIGHNCRFLQGADRTQDAREKLSAAIDSGTRCTVEIRNYRKNGNLIWNELYISPIVNGSGEITHFLGIQNDITQRKKAEQQLRLHQDQMEKEIQERTRKLRDSEEFLTSIIQTVRESLLVLDPDFFVLSANEHFFKTFKVSPEDTIGKHLYELGNHQWDIPQLKELLLKILPTSNPVENFEVEHDFPHIGRKLMLLNAHRIELESEYKDQILLAMEDITDRREMERRKDDFLAIASHEFKTPLTSIKGYLQALERTLPPGPFDKFKVLLSKASAQVNRLNSMMDELLDVSRIKTGNLTLHKAPFDFDKMVQEAVEIIQPGAIHHQIKVVGASGIEVFADENQLIQVMNNLLNNAIKYAPNSKEILVSISRVSNYVKVSVKDYGLGINAEDQKRVFERFFRVSDIQLRFAGMGIGLYVCEQIIKDHGGSLWVESEKGHGSTFSFTIPIKAEPETPE